MTGARSPRLYTPSVLALATGLAAFPLDDRLPLRAEARSRTCGSEIILGLELTPSGRIVRVGLQVRACALGQASAALLAQDARDRAAEDVALTLHGLEAWLEGAGDMPDWPDLALLAPARDHPARHGALLLPWKAASKALSCGAAAG
jgi:NifU-like protein involved in Fe-S cluster formation